FDPIERSYPPPRIAIDTQHYKAFRRPLISFLGEISDRVSPDVAEPDSEMDGTFKVSFPDGSGEGQVIGLILKRRQGGQWDTIDVNEGSMIWGVGRSLDVNEPLLNDSGTGEVNFSISDEPNIFLFAANDSAGSAFTQGSEFELTVIFADGRMPKICVTIGA